MPLKRTPPRVGSSLEPLSTNASYGGSEPNIPTLRDDTDTRRVPLPNVTTRGPKRKYDQDFREELQAFKEDILSTLNSWKESQDNKIEKILNKITELSNEYKEIQESVKFMSDKYDEMKETVNEFHKEKQVQLKYIHELEMKMETMERNLKNSTVEIRNIPKQQKVETANELCNIVENIGFVLNCAVDKKEIRDIYRVNTKTDSYKPIIIDFSSKISKDKFIFAAKTFNRKNPTNKLNTTHLKINDKRTPVYITESLTANGRKLFYKSREYAKEHKFTFCWISYGRIYLRKMEGSKQFRIDCEDDLKNLTEL